MQPFHLRVRTAAQAETVSLQWFGSSAIRPEGARTLARRRDAEAIIASDDVLIDLNPVLAEVAAGIISSPDDLQAAPELLQLKGLLTDADFAELCDALFRFLYQQSQTARTYESFRTFDSGQKRAWSDYNNRILRVWFGTDRKPLFADDISQGFSVLESAEAVTYGVCDVCIPQSHEPGSTGSPWWRRFFVLRADDRLQLRGTRGLGRDVFWRKMSRTLKEWWTPGERNVFVLIHGFNVSFAEAAIRAAQIGYDLKLPGEIAFYSWPSRGNTSDYMSDEATITASSSFIATFLHELQERSGAERIHLFVHSMGNRGLLSALERIIARKQPRLRLGQVFFCAPDEDVRTFKDKIREFPHDFENRTLLVSAEDKAVASAQWLHSYPRVGIVPPVLNYPNIETIEVGGFGILELGHGYFAEAKPVILDIREAIETRKRAPQRKIPKPFGEHFVIDTRIAH